MRYHLALTAALAMALAAPAQARPINLAKAQKAAEREAQATLTAFNTIEDDGSEDDGIRMLSFDVDPCEQVDPKRALCDAGYVLSDGTACENTIRVVVTRSHRLRASDLDEIVCEGDDNWDAESNDDR